MYSLEGAPSFNVSNKKKAFSFNLEPSLEANEPSYVDSYHVESDDDDDDDFIAPVYSDHDDYDNDNYKSRQQKTTTTVSTTKKNKKSKDKNDDKKRKKKEKKSKKEEHNTFQEDDDSAYKSIEQNLYNVDDAQSDRRGDKESKTQNNSTQNTKKHKNKQNSKKEKHKKRTKSKESRERSKENTHNYDDNDSYDDSDLSSVHQEHISDVVMHSKQQVKAQAQDNVNTTTDQSYESSYEDDFENDEAGSRSNAGDDEKNEKSVNVATVHDNEYDDDFEQNSTNNDGDQIDDDDDDYISSVHDSSEPSHEESARLPAEREISSNEERVETVLANESEKLSNTPKGETKHDDHIVDNNNDHDHDHDDNIREKYENKDKNVIVVVQQLMEEQRQEQHTLQMQLAQVIEQMKNLHNKENEYHEDTKHQQQESLSNELNTSLTLDAIVAQVAKTVQAELSSIQMSNKNNSKSDGKDNTISAEKSTTQLPVTVPIDIQETQTLFTRLAHDVREVFHELNLAVVAAEKERLLKDERYRTERAAREREEQLHKEEAVQREVAERTSREHAFWSALEQRESEFRRFMEESNAQNKSEQEARYKRELEERATRLRQFEELHTELLRVEREKLQEGDNELRHRDNLLVQNQMEEIKIQYQRQLDELRSQVEEDRRRTQEQHSAEIALMQTRHTSALEQLNRQHAESLAIMETHSTNASKMEQMMQMVQDEVRAAQEMNATLANERIRILADKEKNMEELKATLTSMIDEMKRTQEDLHHERVRIATLYSQFELALRELRRNGEDDRQAFKEAMMHYDTYREQTEKDHANMLAHIAAERKALHEQREEWLSTKLTAMNELQAERLTISQERTNAAMERERQNRCETQLLQKLHEREDTYKEKLTKLQAELEEVEIKKHEAAQWHETVQVERAALEQEREVFIREKRQLMEQFGEIKQRAEETSEYCERLQEEVAETRAMKRLQWPNNTIPTSANHAALYYLQGVNGNNNNNNNKNNNIDDHSQVSNNSSMNVINQPAAIYNPIKLASTADMMPQHEPAVKSSVLTHAATKFQIDLANQRAILERLSLM